MKMKLKAFRDNNDFLFLQLYRYINWIPERY